MSIFMSNAEQIQIITPYYLNPIDSSVEGKHKYKTVIE